MIDRRRRPGRESIIGGEGKVVRLRVESDPCDCFRWNRRTVMNGTLGAGRALIVAGLLRLSRAGSARIMKAVGNDVAEDKERQKRAEEAERTMAEKIH